MIPCLDVYIVSNDTALLILLQVKAPIKLDTSVWRGLLDEVSLKVTTTLEGTPCFIASIRFNREEDRQLIWNKLNNALTTNVKSKLLSGSHINFHDCNHDEDPKYRISGCGNITTMWSK